MSNTLDIENEIKTVINDSLNKTASSISAFLQSHATIVDTTYTFLEIEPSGYYSKQEEGKVVVLKTEVVGALSGINYVMLTKKEIENLCANSFIGDMEGEDSNQMKIEFLKEIENVLAAATISCFADCFRLDMFGDVPKIQAVHADHIDGLINNETGSLKAKILVKSKLNMPDLAIQPELLWFFNGAFVDKVMNRNGKAILATT
ncbi:hypothetical protein [Reichenbachiella ulvae]|uniref:Chemotaxis phosphatase CheX n=1 Tax=Reichenbachiella ulvae TaxID=2980104 RepID=A0ABT3CP17_9BACT|nr:hypothetical protein [Reichenbachiella ulvae]MCV9385200.1 hypothetical protein [Reichenbachiella ulvae]